MKLKAQLCGKYVNVIGFAAWMGGKENFRWAAVMSWISDFVKAYTLGGQNVVETHAPQFIANRKLAIKLDCWLLCVQL